MTCAACEVGCQRFGAHRNGLQRFRCPQCKKTYTEEHKRLIKDMNLADEKTLLVPASRSARMDSSPHLSAIKTTLSDRCDFAQLVKVYAAAPQADHKYSPPDVTHAEKVPVMGNPDPAKICTSHVERQNRTTRMQMRRLTRLTNGFQQEVGEPVGRVLPTLCVLQLLPHPQDTARNARNGNGDHVARVGSSGFVSVDTSSILAVG